MRYPIKRKFSSYQEAIVAILFITILALILAYVADMYILALLFVMPLIGCLILQGYLIASRRGLVKLNLCERPECQVDRDVVFKMMLEKKGADNRIYAQAILNNCKACREAYNKYMDELCELIP